MKFESSGHRPATLGLRAASWQVSLASRSPPTFALRWLERIAARANQGADRSPRNVCTTPVAIINCAL